MDVSKLSDADLTALSNKQYDKLSNEGLNYLHGQSRGTPSGPDNAHSSGISSKPVGENTASQSSDWWKKSTSDRIQDFVKHPGEAFQQHNTQEQQANPNTIPVTGMDDPALKIAGMVSPESALSLVKSVPKIGNALSSFFAPAAQRSEVLGKVKNIAELEPYVQGKVNEANEMFNAKNMGTPMAMQNSILNGKMVKIDPKSIQGLSPELDQLVSKMNPGEGGLADVPATDALKVRQELNKVAGWKSSPMDPMKAKAIDSQAAAAHQNLSSQFSSIDPAMGDISQGMQQSYNLQKSTLGSAGRSPIQAVTKQDLTTQSRLAQFDQSAGSDLQGLGKDINTAKDRLQAYTPTGLKKLFTIGAPKEAFDLAATPVSRAYDAVGSSIAKTPAASDQAKLFYMLKGLPTQGDQQ